MKDLLVEAGVATAAHGIFTDAAPALAFLDTMTPPFVVKTDGLAAGKGVVVTESLDRGPQRRRRLPLGRGVRRRRPAAGDRGGADRSRALGARRVRRRRGRSRWLPRAGLQAGSATATPGPNTGGMGAYSPVPIGRRRRCSATSWTGSSSRRSPRCGPGASTTAACSTPGSCSPPSGPKMLEYNVRFGDPEMPGGRAPPDLRPGRAAGARRPPVGSDRTPTFTSDAVVTVVCASEGYPAVAPDRGPHRGPRRRPRRSTASTVYCAGVRTGRRGPPRDRGRPGAQRVRHRTRRSRRRGDRAYDGRGRDLLAGHAPPVRHRRRRSRCGGIDDSR